MNMKLDKRIIQAINYNVKEILINEEAYNKFKSNYTVLELEEKFKKEQKNES